MTKRSVHCLREINVTPDQVWQIVSSFTDSWHPAMLWCERAINLPDTPDSMIRRFQMKNDETIYREQRTYFNETERCFRYLLLEGIPDCRSYSAEVRVAAGSKGKSVILWWAQIEASATRAFEIASGTKTILEKGLETLSEKFSGKSKPVSSNFIIDNGQKLALTTVGDGELCLFLHGIGGNRANWSRQLLEVSSFCRAVSMDFRGYGDSKLGENQTTIEDYITDILAVMKHFRAEKINLVGLSYGSWIATSFAQTYPEKMSSLTVSGGCTGMSEAGEKVRTAFLKARLEPLDSGKTPADFAQNVVPLLKGPACSLEVENELLASMSAISAATYRDALTCFTSPPGPLDFTKFNFPVLLMTGEHDQLARPEEIKKVAERIAESQRANSLQPDVQFEVLDNAGHLANLEQPEAYNAVLTCFSRRAILK